MTCILLLISYFNCVLWSLRIWHTKFLHFVPTKMLSSQKCFNLITHQYLCMADSNIVLLFNINLEWFTPPFLQNSSFLGMFILSQRWWKVDINFFEVHLKFHEVYLNLIKVHLKFLRSILTICNPLWLHVIQKWLYECMRAIVAQMWATSFHPPEVYKLTACEEFALRTLM